MSIRNRAWINRFMAVMVAVCLLVTAWPCAVQAAELVLPGELKRIEQQAFYGDTALEEVIVHEGTEVIESEAFAKSGVKSVTLPSSLYSIADNAFSGCENLIVNAQEGSYAYSWAVRNKYIEIQGGEAGEETKVVAANSARAGMDYTVQVFGPAETVRHSIYLVNLQTGEYQVRDIYTKSGKALFEGYYIESSCTYRLTVYTVTINYTALTPVGMEIQVTGQRPAAPVIDLPETMQTNQSLWLDNSINHSACFAIEYFSAEGELIGTDRFETMARESIHLNTWLYEQYKDGGIMRVRCSELIDGIWSECLERVITVNKPQYIVNVYDIPDIIENGHDFMFSFDYEGYADYCGCSFYSDATSQYYSAGECFLGDSSGTATVWISTADLDQGRYSLCAYFRTENYSQYTQVYEKTIEVVGERTDPPEVTAEENDTLVYSDVRFIISTYGADKVAMGVDFPSGDHNSNVRDAQGSMTIWRRAFTNIGIYKLRFAVRRDEIWSAWSNPIEIVVNETPRLALPIIQVASPVSAGEDLTFSFDEIENAEHCWATVQSGNDYGNQYNIDPATPTDLLEIPGFLLSSGSYVLEVNAEADGYESSYGRKSIVVRGTRPEGLEVMTDEPLYAGRRAVFSVITENAEALQVKYIKYGGEYDYDDGTYYEEVPITGDLSQWTYYIPSDWQDVVMTVAFSAKVNGIWSAWKPVSYIVESPPSLEPAVIEIDDEIIAGTDFSFTIGSVEHATWYECGIYNAFGFEMCWYMNNWPLGEIQIQDQYFEPGEYTVKVWAYANGYSTSISEKTFMVVEAQYEDAS